MGSISTDRTLALYNQSDKSGGNKTFKINDSRISVTAQVSFDRAKAVISSSFVAPSLLFRLLERALLDMVLNQREQCESAREFVFPPPWCLWRYVGLKDFKTLNNGIQFLKGN